MGLIPTEMHELIKHDTGMIMTLNEKKSQHFKNIIIGCYPVFQLLKTQKHKMVQFDLQPNKVFFLFVFVFIYVFLVKANTEDDMESESSKENLFTKK